MRLRIRHIPLIVLIAFQTITQLFWLPTAAHSGQVAIPWMMNQGKLLFGHLLEQHAPGSTLIAALAQRLLPLEPLAVAQILNVLLLLALTLLIYRLSVHLADDHRAGLLAAAIWVWWVPVYGNILFYFDTLLGLLIAFALAVVFSSDRQRIRTALIVGLVMGAATIAKQHGWLAVGLLGLWWLVTGRRWREPVVYGLAALVLPGLLIVVLAAQGVLDSYIYWNWSFNFSGLMDSVPLDGDFLRKLLLSNLFVPALALMAFSKARTRRDDWLLIVLMWAAASAVLAPRFGEIHAMGQLPFAAIAGGVVLAALLSGVQVRGLADVSRTFSSASVSSLVLAGIGLALALVWLWTGAVSYVPGPVGIGGTLAYDEFQPVAAAIQERAQPGETLFILPETDSTPQIHPMTGLPPPGTWIKGWYWYFEAPGVLDTLLSEWETAPPDWVVVFPDLLAAGQPGIGTLMDVVEVRYEPVTQVDAIYGHGDAVVYRLVPVAD